LTKLLHTGFETFAGINESLSVARNIRKQRIWGCLFTNECIGTPDTRIKVEQMSEKLPLAGSRFPTTRAADDWHQKAEHTQAQVVAFATHTPERGHAAAPGTVRNALGES
jgi:hypothetical protein